MFPASLYVAVIDITSRGQIRLEYAPSRDTVGKKSSVKSRIPIDPYDTLGDLEEDSMGI